jgi:hypothetical protein
LTNEDHLNISNLSRNEIKIEKANNLPITQRKAMLKKVVSDLYRFTSIKREIRETTLKQKNKTQEIRMRVYKILKNLVWEKFEHRMCEMDTLVKLHRLLDICKDNLKEPIHCFDVYSKIYTASFTEKVLEKLSCIPLLGRVFYSFLVERVYMRYDFLLIMTITLAELIESKQFLRQEFEHWQVIVKEIQFELNNFEMSQTALLQAHELLVKAVQTKNVGKTILNFGYQSLDKLHKSGEIDDLERKALIKHLTRAESNLRFIEKYIRKFNSIKNTDKSLQKEDERDNFSKTRVIRQFSVVFPILKELSRGDMEECYSKLQKHELESYNDEIICQSEQGPTEDFSEDSDHWVYLVQSGMFKIRSSTDRVLRHLSRGNVFGSSQLIAEDAYVLASPMSKSVYYKLPLSYMKQLMEKYPLLQKEIYLSGAYEYLKGCPYSLAKQKTKYFRRLRRISHFHLKKIFKNGYVLIFESTKNMVNYLFKNNFSSIGLFILEGGLRMVHQNPLIQKARRLSKIKEVPAIKEFLEDQHQIKSPRSSQRKSLINRIDKNLFSMKTIQVDPENLEDQQIKVHSGNAVEIRTHNLQELEVMGDRLVVYLLETKTVSFEDKDHISGANRMKVNKINRRKYL